MSGEEHLEDLRRSIKILTSQGLYIRRSFPSRTEDLLTDEQVEHFDRTIGRLFLKSTQKPIDRNHPHQCFQCKKPLKFSELLERNLKTIWWFDPDHENYKKYKHLKKLLIYK